MKINNSYSQNLYQSKTSSTKTVDEEKFSSMFDTLIDKSKITDTKETLVKWEDQLLYPTMNKYDFDPGAYEGYKNLQSYDPIAYEWQTQMMKATNGNKYEDAPEFEAFVKKWMDKGESEDRAISRATTYARAGLLDYGKQRVRSIWNSELPYGDIKQHGFHLIDNEPLKNAVIKTLDSLNYSDAYYLVDSIFNEYPKNEGVPLSFQELLDDFGVKLEELKKLNPEEHKDDKFTFTSDINLKVGAEYQEYNNFILDTLIKFFEDRIKKFDEFVENSPPGVTNNLDGLKNSVNSLIDNLTEEIDVYNSKLEEEVV